LFFFVLFWDVSFEKKDRGKNVPDWLGFLGVVG
jgi:hypothetical protein